MPVTGTDPQLSAKLKSDIRARLEAATGQKLNKDPFLDALCKAIAETVINHLVQNVTLIVNSGIPVATTGGPTAQTGSTTAPGTGKIT